MYAAWKPVIVTCTVLLSGLVAVAQTTTEENKLYLIGPNDTLTELSLQMGTVKSHFSKGMFIIGAGNMRFFTEFVGLAARSRVKPGGSQAFALGMPRDAPLPDRLDIVNTYIMLFRLDVNKKAGTRELLSSSISGAAGLGKTRTAEGVIPLNFTRFDDHAIRIEPRAALAPGEYAFMAPILHPDPYQPRNQILYYCFGID